MVRTHPGLGECEGIERAMSMAKLKDGMKVLRIAVLPVAPVVLAINLLCSDNGRVKTPHSRCCAGFLVSMFQGGLPVLCRQIYSLHFF